MQDQLLRVICIAATGTVVLCLLSPSSTRAQGVVGGELTKWHTVVVDFQGPNTSETAATNPFTDYRLDVTFTHAGTGKQYVVPGFYDGDGNGGGSGDVWRVRFNPDEAGQWDYTADFRSGAGVVTADPGDLNTFTTTGPHGQSDSFTVAALDADAPGFKSQGRLEYAGNHYLKFRDGGYFIKGGADSPENFLGYSGFDNTPNFKHQYAPHRNDWQAGDPDWTNDAPNGSGVRDGRNIIGALNYLGDQRVNSIYFLPMNIGGDGKDTYPYQAPINTGGSAANDNTRFDISKLTQWETVLNHAQERGINLNIVLNEAEAPNKNELDNATLGPERKLFYREMIARFGHHNAMQWMLSEEYNRGLELAPSAVKSFAQFIQDLDPYDHPISVHNGNFGNWPGGTNFPDEHTDLPGPGQRAEWEPFFGDPRFSLTSYQNYNEQGIGDEVEYLRARSALKGRPIPIMIDEPESLDALSADNVRKHMTWDIYLSGGGVEWFVRGSDQSLEDFRTYETVWEQTWHARKFMQENLPFWEMTPNDDLLRNEDSDFGGAEVFAKPGEVYAFYLPDGSNDDNPNTAGAIEAGENGPPEFDLTAEANQRFRLRWYDPRTGQFDGDLVVEFTGGAWVSLGLTPDGFQNTNDWAGLIERIAEAGDANIDGRVDEFDLALMAANWQQAGDWRQADFNGDGTIDSVDLQLLAERWGAGVGGEVASLDALLTQFPSIPEPGTAATFAALAGLFARWRM
ncbi:MAG: DUF5060 domain-containing protein [Planctomycetes bacterium]|jgi:hypothetical protein|nr:DUF5060 domain-containing protein [Planctomycetota bacterium]